MPAASYREGPDGHSSRKQNSKRRRAKCSPSFVSGRVIGHGDISLRCIPECSAMAPRRAVPAACPSRASTLSFVLLAGRSPSPAFGAVFFAGRAAVIWCGANPGARPWQHLRECALGRLAVAIFSRGAFSGVLPMAKCSRNAFPSVRRRQDCALMRSWPDWQWQYSRAMRSRVSIRGNIPPRCVPGRPSVTIFSPHASQKRPRTGKSPVRGKIRAPCIRKRAPFGKICAPCIRKAPQTAFRERTARRSCQEGPLFAARAPRIMHGAQILPSAVASNRPSARNTGAAEQREPPKLDRTTQETLPRRQRPRRLLGSKYRQQLPRYRHRALPTPASSLSPSEQLCHCRQRHLWRQRSRRHRPADLPSCARPKGGLPSLLAAPVFCALGGCDRLINARRSLFYAIISLWLRKNRHPSGKTQALPIQWVGCSRGHVPYRTINKEKRLRWQLLHIALSARKRRKW